MACTVDVTKATSNYSANKPKKMEHQRMKWEYKVHLVDNDGDGASTFSIDYLNELGEDGWELLHVNRLQGITEKNSDLKGKLIRTKRVALWFKRPKTK